MAEHLVSIFGTEKDKVNCPFYYKIGACRHGERCSRIHNKPLFSQTILLENLYQSPDQIIAYARMQGLPPPEIPEEELRYHFDDFYDDVLDEMEQYGVVEALKVCENLADHLAGNTYVKFRDEESAQAALHAMRGRWYAGRPVKAEFSPVTDFREGKCRPFERRGVCDRGDFCHFMHLRRLPGASNDSDDDRDSDYGSRRRDDRDMRYRRGRDRDYERERSRDYDRFRERDRDHFRDRDRGRDHGRDRDRDEGKRERGGGSRDWEGDRDRDRDRERDRDRYRSHDRDMDRDREVDRDTGRVKRRREREKARERDRSRDYDRGGERSGYRDRRSEKRYSD